MTNDFFTKGRHTREELERLEKYKKNHPDDSHDPTDFEMFCDEVPGQLSVSYMRIDI